MSIEFFSILRADSIYLLIFSLRGVSVIILLVEGRLIIVIIIKQHGFIGEIFVGGEYLALVLLFLLYWSGSMLISYLEFI